MTEIHNLLILTMRDVSYVSIVSTSINNIMFYGCIIPIHYCMHACVKFQFSKKSNIFMLVLSSLQPVGDKTQYANAIDTITEQNITFGTGC